MCCAKNTQAMPLRCATGRRRMRREHGKSHYKIRCLSLPLRSPAEPRKSRLRQRARRGELGLRSMRAFSVRPPPPHAGEIRARFFGRSSLLRRPLRGRRRRRAPPVPCSGIHLSIRLYTAAAAPSRFSRRDVPRRLVRELTGSGARLEVPRFDAEIPQR